MSEFISVSYKKRKKKEKSLTYSNVDISSPTYITNLHYKVTKARDFVKSSQLYSDILSSIEEASLQKKSNVEEIVCYGLGSITDSPISRYQFAFLIELKKCFKCHVFIYDPVFSVIDKEVFLKENVKLIEVNEFGKRKVFKTTLFFLPHCPKPLFNNVIAANWGMNLSNCIVIGNSLSEIMCSTTDKKLKLALPYLYYISSFVTERKIVNNFEYQDVFNDFSIHLFLDENLLLVDKSVWEKNFEVDSNEEQDFEFITEAVKNIGLEN